MNKILNLIFLLIFFLFFIFTYKYYISNKNIRNISINRLNIENIFNQKLSNIPILENDTKNVIEFNSSFFEEKKENKPRSFWNLLKSE